MARRMVYTLSSMNPVIRRGDGNGRPHPELVIDCPGCKERHGFTYVVERSGTGDVAKRRGRVKAGAWRLLTCIDERIDAFTFREELVTPCGLRLSIAVGLVDGGSS